MPEVEVEIDSIFDPEAGEQGRTADYVWRTFWR